MKKIIALLSTLLLALALVACGGGGPDAPKEPPYPAQTADLKDCELTLYKHEIVESEIPDKKDIIFYYHYKNKSDKDKVYAQTVGATHTQGGTRLFPVSSSDREKPVPPGETYDIEMRYTLNDLETPVNIKVVRALSKGPHPEFNVDIK